MTDPPHPGGSPPDPRSPAPPHSADDTGDAFCPWCGESVTLALDPGGAAIQRYVEDCPVCCRPWNVEVRWDRHGRVGVTLATDDDA